MDKILKGTYSKYYIAGLLCIIVCAFCSLGYHQMDEHFMMLEYAAFKYHEVPAKVVPWEFKEMIRPSLQPVLARGLFNFLDFLGCPNPFTKAAILRLLTGLLYWLAGSLFVSRAAALLTHERVKLWFIAAANLLWFVPYLAVRFSSENFAGIAFVAALLCLPASAWTGKKFTARNGGMFYAGLLLGLSFYFRFQMAFAVLGFAAYLVAFVRPLPRALLFLVLGALVAVACNMAVDAWFYERMVFTPYNYFLHNIVYDAASNYGTAPFWAYIPDFLNIAFWPVSFPLACLFFAGCFLRPRLIGVWIFIPFFLGHAAVAHKELRFLFPMLLPFLWIAFNGWDALAERKFSLRGKGILLRIAAVLNILLLGFRIAAAPKTTHLYYRFLYQYAGSKPLQIVTLGPSIYDEGYNEIYFYRPKHLQEDTLTLQTLHARLAAEQPDSLVVVNFSPRLPDTFAHYSAEQLYVYLPQFILRNNTNDWQSRSDIWSIWLLRKQHD